VYKISHLNFQPLLRKLPKTPGGGANFYEYNYEYNELFYGCPTYVGKNFNVLFLYFFGTQPLVPRDAPSKVYESFGNKLSAK